MKTYFCRWRGFPVLLLIIISTVMMGCSSSAKHLRHQLGSIDDPLLSSVMRRNLAATGGVDNWATIEQIQADVLATIFGDDSGKTLIEQHHCIELAEKWTAKVVSTENEAVTVEEIDKKGQPSLSLVRGYKVVNEEDPQVIRGTAIKLRLLAHAVTGPVSMLQKGLSLRYAGLERQGGRAMHRIEVLVNPEKAVGVFSAATWADVLVFWIDSETYLTRRLWLRYPKDDQGGVGYLGVRINNHTRLDQGIVLPGMIELIHSDQHQQFSENPVLTCEYLDWEVLREK